MPTSWNPIQQVPHRHLSSFLLDPFHPRSGSVSAAEFIPSMLELHRTALPVLIENHCKPFCQTGTQNMFIGSAVQSSQFQVEHYLQGSVWWSPAGNLTVFSCDRPHKFILKPGFASIWENNKGGKSRNALVFSETLRPICCHIYNYFLTWDGINPIWPRSGNKHDKKGKLW